MTTFKEYLETFGLAPRTIMSYTGDQIVFERDIFIVDQDSVDSFIRAHNYPRIRFFLRHYLNWRIGKSHNIIIRKVTGKKKVRYLKKISKEEVDMLIQYCRDHNLLREEIAVRLMFEAGLRATEVCSLMFDDVIEGEIPLVKGIGKNDKEFAQDIKPETCRLVKTLQGGLYKDDDLIFPKGRQWLWKRIKDIGAPALGKKIHPHVIRHAIAYYLVNVKKVPLPVVKNFMRHGHINSTMVYSEAEQEEVRHHWKEAMEVD